MLYEQTLARTAHLLLTMVDDVHKPWSDERSGILHTVAPRLSLAAYLAICGGAKVFIGRDAAMASRAQIFKKLSMVVQ